MILIAGATGLVGGDICRRLLGEGRQVRALVRRGADAAKVNALQKAGADLYYGDLKDSGSLAGACKDVKAVISTASSTFSRLEGDSIESVDRDGQASLIDAAKEAGVDHFVFVSFRYEPNVDHPLKAAKRYVEERLKKSGMAYTILKASCFMEIWLSPAVGFDVAAGKARVYGQGVNKLSWISCQDVARFAAAAVSEPAFRNQVLEIGGPEALSPLEVIRAFEAAGGPEITVEHVPEAALLQIFDQAADSLEKTFAGLMLMYAAGDAIDMSETQNLLKGGLTPLRDYVSQTLLQLEKAGATHA